MQYFPGVLSVRDLIFSNTDKNMINAEANIVILRVIRTLYVNNTA